MAAFFEIKYEKWELIALFYKSEYDVYFINCKYSAIIKFMQFMIFIGAAVSLVFNIPYAWATIIGRVRPNKVSWLLWSIAPAIGFFAALSKGWNWGQFPVLISFSTTALIFVCSFVNRKSFWAIERFDVICGLVSLLALVVWGLTREPDLAICFAILADIMAAIPTIVKAWRYPETETWEPFVAGVFNAGTGFFAMSVWSFTSLAFPIYLMLVNGIIALVVLRKKWWRVKAHD